MTIRRQRRPERYTQIDNNVFRDNNLSFQAMGMLAYLLSKPHDWTVMVPQLAKVTHGTAKKTGRDGVYVILKELIAAGYVVREKQHSGDMEYIVLDEPNPENTEQAESSPEKPNPEKPEQANEPDPEKPDPEKPDPDFPTLQITDLNKVTDLDKTPIAPLEKSQLSEIPPGLNLAAWQEWINYKRQIKKPYRTERGERVKAEALIKLAKGDHATQAFLVSHAINNEWKGIYAPRDWRPKFKTRAETNQDAVEAWLSPGAPSDGRTFDNGEF